MAFLRKEKTNLQMLQFCNLCILKTGNNKFIVSSAYASHHAGIQKRVFDKCNKNQTEKPTLLSVNPPPLRHKAQTALA